MLPTRYDVALVPALLITREHAPLYPSDAPTCPGFDRPDVQDILPDVAVKIVNQCGLESSRNPVRMFCFNLLSENQWYNEAFFRVFRLAVGHLLLIHRRQPTASLRSLLEHTVEDFLTLYSSSLVFEHPELRSALPPTLIEASSQNAGMFHHVVKEIESMTHPYYPPPPMPMQGHPPGYGPHPQQQPQLPPPSPGYYYVFDQRHGYIQVPIPPQQSFAQPYMQPPHHGHAPGVTRDYHRPGATAAQTSLGGSVAGNFARQDGYFERPPIPESHRAEMTIHPGMNRQEASDRWRSPPAPPPGEAEMKREAHEVERPTYVLSLAEEQKVKTLNKNTQTIKTHGDPVVDTNLDTILEQFRADCLVESQKDTEIVFQRRFGVLLSTVLSDKDLRSEVKQGMQKYSMTDFALYLQRQVTESSVQMQQSESNPSSPLRLTSLFELDYKLVRRVNFFLKHGLDTSIQIGSFMEDYPNLANYILKRMGKTGVARLKGFEKNLRTAFSGSLIGTLTDALLDSVLTTTLNVTGIPHTFSLTYVPVERSLLFLPNSHVRVVLEPVKDDTLLRLTERLFTDVSDTPFGDIEIEHHVLILRDGFRYMVGTIPETDDSGARTYLQPL